MKQNILLVLVGITASRKDRDYVSQYFNQHSDHDVFVPELPYRKGLKATASWLQQYLEDVANPSRYESASAVVYIAGRMLLRCLPADSHTTFDRAVYFRGPFQERIADTMVNRIGKRLSTWLGGQTMVDLTESWPASLPQDTHATHQGLIIELGQSRLARLLGIHSSDIPGEAWNPDQLLPGADAVLMIPQSHDDVYTTDSVLGAALDFIRNGTFPENGRPV